jgi:hypothetical protein
VSADFGAKMLEAEVIGNGIPSEAITGIVIKAAPPTNEPNTLAKKPVRNKINICSREEFIRK